MTSRRTEHSMRGWRAAGAVAGVMLLLVAAVAAYFAYYFDANSLKPRIAAAVLQYTGRALTIEGDLTVALLPLPHATARQIRLAEAPGFSDQAFAEAGVISIYPRLLPLLHRQLEIREIVLEQPRLHLQRNNAGESNWADLEKRYSETGPGAPAVSVIVRGLRIQNGELRFDDQTGKRHGTVSNLNLRVGGLGHDSPGAIEAQADVLGEEPKFKGVLGLSGQVAVNHEARIYNVDELQLRFEGETTKWGKFALEAKGRGEYAGSSKSLSGTFQIALKDPAGQVTADALGTAGPNAEMPPRIDIRLNVAEFSPRKLLKRLGRKTPAMRDASALTRAWFAMDVAGDQEQLLLHPTGRLDDSKLTGQIMLQGGFEHPVVRFSLAVDQIDLDRYRPPRPKGPPSSGGEDAISKISNEELRALGLNIRGTVKVGTITLNGDRTNNFVAKLEWNP